MMTPREHVLAIMAAFFASSLSAYMILHMLLTLA
jgi:hypothetical protein